MQRRFRRWSATAWMDRSVMRLHCPMFSVCKSSKEWARRIRPSSETWQALIESCLRLESPWATYPRAWSSILSQKETSREVMRDPPSARYAFIKTSLRQLSCQLEWISYHSCIRNVVAGSQIQFSQGRHFGKVLESTVTDWHTKRQVDGFELSQAHRYMLQRIIRKLLTILLKNKLIYTFVKLCRQIFF